MRLNENALNVPRVVRLEPFEESLLLVGHGASARFGALWRVRPQQRVHREHFSLDGVVEHGLRGRVVILPRPRLTRRTRPSQTPTKSIGAFLAKEQAEMAEHPEMIFVEDSGRGWRRVVASPEPKKIVEAPWCEADQGNLACLIWRGAVL